MHNLLSLPLAVREKLRILVAHRHPLKHCCICVRLDNLQYSSPFDPAFSSLHHSTTSRFSFVSSWMASSSVTSRSHNFFIAWCRLSCRCRPDEGYMRHTQSACNTGKKMDAVFQSRLACRAPPPAERATAHFGRALLCLSALLYLSPTG